jgi:hypothetical protein
VLLDWGQRTEAGISRSALTSACTLIQVLWLAPAEGGFPLASVRSASTNTFARTSQSRRRVLVERRSHRGFPLTNPGGGFAVRLPLPE